MSWRRPLGGKLGQAARMPSLWKLRLRCPAAPSYAWDVQQHLCCTPWENHWENEGKTMGKDRKIHYKWRFHGALIPTTMVIRCYICPLITGTAVSWLVFKGTSLGHGSFWGMRLNHLEYTNIFHCCLDLPHVISPVWLVKSAFLCQNIMFMG